MKQITTPPKLSGFGISMLSFIASIIVFMGVLLATNGFHYKDRLEPVSVEEQKKRDDAVNEAIGKVIRHTIIFNH